MTSGAASLTPKPPRAQSTLLMSASESHITVTLSGTASRPRCGRRRRRPAARARVRAVAARRGGAAPARRRSWPRPRRSWRPARNGRCGSGRPRRCDARRRAASAAPFRKVPLVVMSLSSQASPSRRISQWREETALVGSGRYQSQLRERPSTTMIARRPRRPACLRPGRRVADGEDQGHRAASPLARGRKVASPSRARQ